MRSFSLTPVLLGSLLSLTAPTAAHSEHAEVVEGATYAEIHMAQEHHMVRLSSPAERVRVGVSRGLGWDAGTGPTRGRRTRC